MAIRPGRTHLSEKKLTIAVDFDGTLIQNRYPYIENPNMVLINYIKANRDKYIWILWTCRCGSQLKKAVKYMKNEHGIEFDYVNENADDAVDDMGQTRKIYADIYIDDRALTFKDFKEVIGC